MTLDPTISTGNIISIISTLGGIAIGYWGMAAKFTKIEMKVDLLWDWFRKEHKIDEGKK